MKIHDLQARRRARTARRKRVGRGIGGKGGKTAGRGTKGQKARGTVPVGFEGGQMPLHMRVPKLQGLQQPVPGRVPGASTSTCSTATGLDEVTPETLHAQGLTHKGALVKVLGRGEITRAVTVKAHALLEVGRGGHHRRRRYAWRSCRCRWGDRRPPAKGNQLTNR